MSYLVLETLRSDHEVQQSDFHADLGKVVRVAELGRYVKPEVVAALRKQQKARREVQQFVEEFEK